MASMFKSGHFRASHFASAMLAGAAIPTSAIPSDGGSGNAKRKRDEWAVRIGDKVYSTFAGDLKRQVKRVDDDRPKDRPDIAAVAEAKAAIDALPPVSVPELPRYEAPYLIPVAWRIGFQRDRLAWQREFDRIAAIVANPPMARQEMPVMPVPKRDYAAERAEIERELARKDDEEAILAILLAA